MIVYDNAAGTREPGTSGMSGTSGSAAVAFEVDGLQATPVVVACSTAAREGCVRRLTHVGA